MFYYGIPIRKKSTPKPTVVRANVGDWTYGLEPFPEWTPDQKTAYRILKEQGKKSIMYLEGEQPYLGDLLTMVINW